MSSLKTILVVGATGAQGAAVVRVLSATNLYHILLFTRDTTSSRSQELLRLQNTEAVANETAQAYDLARFEAAARKSYGVFINTDGFSLGEQAETYWGIRLYETAVRSQVKHIVYSGLDDHYRGTGYDFDFYVGHFQGKARVQSFIKGQPPSDSMWTITRTGPYIEMLSESLKPTIDEEGTYVFKLPLADGEIVSIHLADYGRYVDWIFRNPSRSAGLDLGIALAHTTGQDIADAFEKTTGRRAKYEDIPMDVYTRMAFKDLPQGPDTKIGYRSVSNASTLNMTYGENFKNFWNLFRATKGNSGVIKRDYNLLDEILPDRVRSVREWMERTGYTGEAKALLKDFR